MTNQATPEVNETIERFREYMKTEKAVNHLAYLREREPQEAKEILFKLQTLPKDSSEFTEYVLYGLLPNHDTKYAKRVSAAPAFMNIKKFFARFNYSESDWRELSQLIYTLVLSFQRDSDHLETYVRDFISHRLSKALQCGSLSPIFFAINPQYPIVNNRTIRWYRALYFLVFGEPDELSQRLEDYLSDVAKINALIHKLQTTYGFNEGKDPATLDLFCYWYDLHYGSKEGARVTKERPAIDPIDEKRMEAFFQSITCSEPQPFHIGIGDRRNLQKLDSKDRIIYSTEFQRGYVWDLPRKQKLIDSILRGYNINTIYFREIQDGKFECLDGQQRLKTVLKEFLNDQFPINPKVSPEFKRQTLFSELPEALKIKIRSFMIYAIIFYTDNDEETCKIFLRLQEGLPLNAAEKLNAMIGVLRNEIVELSKHPFMKSLGIDDYRFTHRYLVAQIFLLTLRNQVTDVKARYLQELYALYRKSIPSETIKKTITRTLTFLQKQFGEDAAVIEFNADFVSLYLLAKHIVENYGVVDNTNLNLKNFFVKFMSKVGEVESSEGDNAPHYDYKTYRKSSADSKDSIDRRFKVILTKFLEFSQGLVPKDPKRGYDGWEKLAVYDRDKGICQICLEATPFEKGTVDHRVPHSKGGPTTLENGQWACIPCNATKLDKTQ